MCEEGRVQAHQGGILFSSRTCSGRVDRAIDSASMSNFEFLFNGTKFFYDKPTEAHSARFAIVSPSLRGSNVRSLHAAIPGNMRPPTADFGQRRFSHGQCLTSAYERDINTSK